ncbi:hypothetical protein GCM10022295_28660 [Streptomyces osmaniensis]|uniref:Uncharacterized protein n=1 Tax=Streptomyces osmaniensis TaxID=593134 RepID=A0ABP6W261_9ACTN
MPPPHSPGSRPLWPFYLALSLPCDEGREITQQAGPGSHKGSQVARGLRVLLHDTCAARGGEPIRELPEQPVEEEAVADGPRCATGVEGAGGCG